MIKLPVGARVVVRGGRTELDPDFYGPLPSVERGRIALAGTLTAALKLDDGKCVAGIPWPFIEADDG